METATPIPKTSVLIFVNVTNSHTVYILKIEDDRGLKVAARFAPRGNEYSLKYILNNDCGMRPSVGVIILESIASMYSRKLYNSDVKSAFLLNGAPNREVYIKSPFGSNLRSTYLLRLETAAHIDWSMPTKMGESVRSVPEPIWNRSIASHTSVVL